MPTVPASYVSPEEYLERERKAETRSEYVRGEIFAMACASVRHGRIVRNLVTQLESALRDNRVRCFRPTCGWQSPKPRCIPTRM